jgi:MoaA/NifB/PqqE/SkfB family radical SAM enzyme/SAM-dependent methyltransferase
MVEAPQLGIEFLQELVRDIQAIPGENPSLSAPVILATRMMRLDSEYFVRKCLERLVRVPSVALSMALDAIGQRARTDYRLSVVLACCSMQLADYEAAVRHSRSACDRCPTDLFAQNTLIACSRGRAAQTGASCEFDGIEEYLAGSFCERPWSHLEISWEGNAFLCCPHWLPLRIGDARSQSQDEIWNSGFAMNIRESILDGSFRFCSKIYCPKIAGRSLPKRPGNLPESRSTPSSMEQLSEFPTRVRRGPKKLALCYDKSCNLACLQCRREFYVASRKEQESMDRDFLPLILHAAADAESVYMNGGGDVFVGKHSRHVLKLLNRQQFPQLRFSFITNGQLLNEKTFRDFDLYGRVREIEISVDAARPETYRAVRRGGDFKRLESNLAFLDHLRSAVGEKFNLELNFTVSSLNFREVPEFVKLGKRYRVDATHFSVIRCWDHLSPAEFESLSVANPSHPEHEEFLRVMHSPELSDPIVDYGSVAPYRRQEMQLREQLPVRARGAGQSVSLKPSLRVPEAEMVLAYRQFDGAIAALRSVGQSLVNRFPRDPQARFYLADVLKAGGLDDVARKQYQALLEMALPNERRRIEQAIKQCESDRDCFPPDFAAYVVAGELGAGPNLQTWRDYMTRDVQRGREIVRQLRQRTPLRGKRVLDVGCGYGGMLTVLAEQGAQAAGIEIGDCPSRVGQHRLRDLGLQVDWHQGDLCDQEFIRRLGTFDVIVCQDVLEHVLDTSRAITNLCALLRNGGVLFVQVPNKYAAEYILADHHYALFGISLLSRAQAIEYWRLPYAQARVDYTVGYLRSEKYYRQAFARQRVTLEPTDHSRGIGDFLVYGPQMSSLAARLRQDVYPGLRPELQRRIQTRAAKVAKLYAHAGQVLKSLERNPAQLGNACDQVVRRLCRGVWGFVGAKSL